MNFTISAISGRCLEDCALLILRSKWEDFADDETTEWLVVRRKNTAMHVAGSGRWRARDLWLSPKGDLYLVGTHDGLNGLHRAAEAHGHFRWTTVPEVDSGSGVVTLPHGVWGLADDHIFCWGGGWLDGTATADASSALTWFFDGRTWREIRSPGPMLSVHGADRGSIFTVGERGLVAHWDGARWVEMARPTHLPLGRLHVVSVDEAYAATLDGEIFEGSQHGWQSLSTSAGLINGITKHGNDVLIATPRDVQRIQGGKLVPFQPHVDSYVFQAGETFIWTDSAGVAETRDFSSFRQIRGTELEALVNADYFPY